MAGQESLLACGLAFINSCDGGGGWGRVFLSKACETHTPGVWIFQLATADPFDFVTR